jgi:hypothetical protein
MDRFSTVKTDPNVTILVMHLPHQEAVCSNLCTTVEHSSWKHGSRESTALGEANIFKLEQKKKWQVKS